MAKKRQSTVFDQKQAMIIAPSTKFPQRLFPSKIVDDIYRLGSRGSSGDQILQSYFTALRNAIAHGLGAGKFHGIEFRPTVVGWK